MKIAVSASGPKMDAPVDLSFGRAPYFLIIDTENGDLIEAIDNSIGVNAAQGAGIHAAAMLAEKNIQAVLTGYIGPKAMPVIEKAKIQLFYNISGTVRQSVAAFTNKDDSPAEKTPPANTRPQAPSPGKGRGQGGGGGKGRGGMGRCRLS